MIFNSLEFLLFLPVVFLAYWLVFRTVKWQNAWVVASSFFFYGWWDWRFLGLIILTILLSYGSALWIEKSEKRKKRQWILTGNIIVNLAILATFKYFDFFMASLGDMLGAIGIFIDPLSLQLVLPVGISFYTFQAIGYSVDVYRGQVKAERDIVAMAAFISFFPQLVAGPIERASNLLPQFSSSRHFSYPEAADGCRRMLWGFFKKIVIADNCAMVTGPVFSGWQHQNVPMLMMGAVLFTFQIYCDFSGYSDIAIGCARLFGIRLNRNFLNPYLSRSIPEFWTRWHISLSSWFRDYLYIPLGGGRGGKWKKGRNIFLVFLLSGLWHGAAYGFVVWGLAHATLQIPYIARGKKGKYAEPATLRQIGLVIFTFIAVVLAWIPFVAPTLSDAWGYIVRMFTSFDFQGGFQGGKWVCLLCMGLMLAEWFTRHREYVLDFGNNGVFKYRMARWILYYCLFLAIILFPGVTETFIYFQF